MSNLINIGGKFYKEHKIILIPTEERTRLYLSNNGTELNYATIPAKFATGVNLFIVSDEDIAELDWVTDGIHVIQIKEGTRDIAVCWAKIIASSIDKGLGIPRKYIDELFATGILKEVLVEYEFSHHTPESEQAYIQDLREDRSVLVEVYKLKVYQSVFITIKTQESTDDKKFTKNDMLNFAEHCMLKLVSTQEGQYPEVSAEDLTKIKSILNSN